MHACLVECLALNRVLATHQELLVKSTTRHSDGIWELNHGNSGNDVKRKH